MKSNLIKFINLDATEIPRAVENCVYGANKTVFLFEKMKFRAIMSVELPT